jgi:hypothetical protein
MDRAISERARGSRRDGRTVARLAAVLAGLSAVAASAATVPTGFEQLLQLGSGDARGELKWGASLAEIQRVYTGSVPEASMHPVPTLIFQATVADDGCEYKAYLYRATRSNVLGSVRLEHAAGAPEKCRARLEQLLKTMYGTPSTARTEAGWRRITSGATLSGPMVYSLWQTKTACIKLSWKEGTGYPGSPFAVTLGDVRNACGYDDEVVSVPREP